MVRICIISTHSFHQTALLLLLGVSLCSHLSYVPPHLTQISLHHSSSAQSFAITCRYTLLFWSGLCSVQGKANVYLAPWWHLSCNLQSQACWPEQPELQALGTLCKSRGSLLRKKKEKRKASVLQADLGAAAYFPSSGQTGCSYEMGIAKRLKTCCCEFQSCLAGTAGTMKVPVY